MRTTTTNMRTPSRRGGAGAGAGAGAGLAVASPILPQHGVGVGVGMSGVGSVGDAGVEWEWVDEPSHWLYLGRNGRPNGPVSSAVR